MILSSLILAGCGEREFGGSKIQYRIEAEKIKLDGEQIVLTRGQVDCGVQSELWEVQELGQGRLVGRLNQSARDLGFGDDVQVVEPEIKNPYAQLRGSFILSLIQINNIRDDGPHNKVVDAKIGVRINHACFDNPLPVLLGVKRGKFTDTVGTQVRFRLDDDWMYDEIVH